MKKISLAFLFLVIFIFIFSKHSLAENLLINGDFEQGTIDPWKKWGGDLLLSGEKVYEGNSSGKFITRTSGTKYFYQDEIEVQSNANYKFSGWVFKNSSEVEYVYLKVRWFDINKDVISGELNSLRLETNHSDYQFLSVEGLSPEDAYFAEIKVLIRNKSGNKAVNYFDNFYFGVAQENVNTPTEGLNPTVTATATPSLNPTPTPTPDTSPRIRITNINNLTDVKVGVKFYPDYTLENFKPNTRYRLKVRIGQETNKMDFGQTESENSEWLHDKRIWDVFPEIETDKDGKKSGGLRARIKEGSPEGDYFLHIRAYEVETKKTINSQDYKINAGAQPVPSPTVQPTNTPKQTLTPTITSTPQSTSALTPTLTPTLTLVQTPTPISNDNPSSTPKDYSLPEPEVKGVTDTGALIYVYGESDDQESKVDIDQRKILAGGLVGTGGLLLGGAGLSPKLKKIFDKIKK